MNSENKVNFFTISFSSSYFSLYSVKRRFFQPLRLTTEGPTKSLKKSYFSKWTCAFCNTIF